MYGSRTRTHRTQHVIAYSNLPLFFFLFLYCLFSDVFNKVAAFNCTAFSCSFSSFLLICLFYFSLSFFFFLAQYPTLLTRAVGCMTLLQEFTMKYLLLISNIVGVSFSCFCFFGYSNDVNFYEDFYDIEVYEIFFRSLKCCYYCHFLKATKKNRNEISE